MFQLADGTIQTCNAEASKILGYGVEQLIGADFLEISWQTIHQDGSVFFPETYPAIASLRTGQAYSDVIMGFYQPSGDLIWLSIDTLPLFKANNTEPYGVEVTLTDVTQDISAKIPPRTLPKARSSQTVTSRLPTDSLPEVVYVFDVIKQENVYINSQAYESLGYSPKQILEMGADFVTQVMHPEDLAKFPAHIARLHRSKEGEVLKLEYRMRHQNGEWRWFCSQDRVHSRTADNSLQQILGIARDISDRKQTEKALQQSKDELKLITEVIPQHIWTVLPNGEVDYFNQRWLEYTGIALEGTLDSGWLSVVHPEDISIVKQTWAESVSSAKKYSVKARLRGADGIYRWFIVRAIPLHNEQGEIVKWYGTNTSITKIKQLEEKLVKQTEDLINANRLKDEFLAIVSHELRTPLNPILGWSQLLLSGKLDADKTAQGIAIIEKNAKLQSQLINDLLDVSRILRGKLDLNKNPLNLELVIRSALTTVQLAAEAKSIQVETRFEPNIGQVLGDANRLQQIVWNLVSNAIKFTSEGGRVTVTLESDNQYALIQVTDTGKGIEPEFITHVFERFRQAESSSTREFGGLGLGLAIVRQLSELHGGTVAVSSPGLGRGATFSVRLPLINAPSVEQTEIDNETIDRAVQANHFNGIKIMVVDDDADSLDILTLVLEQEGAEVRSASSAESTLEAFSESTPDLIISDIGMPTTDGYTLITQLRALPQGKNLPAIALTAYAGDGDRQRSMDAGFQKHLSKPINIPELITTIILLMQLSN